MHKSRNPRMILRGIDARRRLLQGAETFSKAVSVTYGPFGSTVMLDRAHGLLTTKDGVTVARQIDLPDPVANMACQVFKEACVKVNNDAGDGTTSAAIVAAALLKEGMKLAEAGFNPVHMARGMKAAAEEATRGLWSMARPIETQAELERVALIASNGDSEVAEAMATAVMAVGKNGNVSVEDGKGVETVLVFKDGMEIDRGVCSPLFLQGKNERELPGALVACINGTLRTVDDVRDLLEVASQFGGRELVVFADDVVGEALATMTLNDSKGLVKVVAVKAPGNFKRLDYLGDIAALSGATLIDPGAGGDWKTWDMEWFGMVAKAVVRDKQTVLEAVNEASETIRQRIEEITAQIPGCSSEYDADRLKERRAALEGGLCIMQIGAHTEAELKEKRARVEDALGSVQAALATGLLPGGGVSYLEASLSILELAPSPDDVTPEFLAGWNAVGRALQEPLKMLAENAGKGGSALVSRLTDVHEDEANFWIGWDAVADEFRDLGDSSNLIADPAQVVVSVIEAAVSSASALITSEVSICSEQ